MANNKKNTLTLEQFGKLFSVAEIDEYTEFTSDAANIPCLKLKGMILFPNMTTSFDVNDQDSINLCRKAKEKGAEIFVVTQKEMTELNFPSANEFFKVGVKEAGCELTSVYSKKADYEYLWQGDEAVWYGGNGGASKQAVYSSAGSGNE